MTSSMLIFLSNKLDFIKYADLWSGGRSAYLDFILSFQLSDKSKCHSSKHVISRKEKSQLQVFANIYSPTYTLKPWQYQCSRTACRHSAAAVSIWCLCTAEQSQLLALYWAVQVEPSISQLSLKAATVFQCGLFFWLSVELILVF